MVAMHFVLEAGFFVQHYPGIQIASIGPRIVEPHSTSERVELKTIADIWQVLLELLRLFAHAESTFPRKNGRRCC
jgi:dipeptidase D